MRKAAGIVLVVAGCFLLYALLPGMGWHVRSTVQLELEKTSQTIKVWFDKTAPTTPQNLTGGPAPTIQRVARYYNASHLTEHAMAPFDSTGGDLLVVCAGTHEDALLAPSDNFNNTWISLAGPTNFGPTSSSAGINLRLQIWYAKNLKTGPNHVLTMALSKKEALVLSMFVVKGSNAVDPIDAVSTIGNDAETRTLTPTSPRITTTHSNALLIGFGKSLVSEMWGAGGGFAFQPAASSDFLVAESGLAATPGNYDATFVLGSPTNWQAAVVAVRPAAPTITSQITLAWHPSSDNVGVVGYQVERCGRIDCEDFAQVGASKDTSFVDSSTPLAPATYRYRVRAIDAAFNVSKFSNTITAVVP